MSKLKKLKSLNELVNRMLCETDKYSEHLLYRTDRFVDMRARLKSLVDDAREDHQIAPTPALQEELRKELDRANRLLLFLHYVEETRKRVKQMDEEPLTDNKDLRAIEYMLKMKMALAQMQDDIIDGHFTDAVDQRELDQVFDMDATSVFRIFKDSRAAAAVKILKSETTKSEIKDAKIAIRQAVKNGTLQQYSPVVAKRNDDDSVRFEMEQQDSPKDIVKALLKSNRVKAAIEQYQNAEKFWYGSALTDEEERASRRAFMECYAEDLSGLYEALNVSTIHDKESRETAQSQILGELMRQGLDGMMRDYHDMMLDRKAQDKVAQDKAAQDVDKDQEEVDDLEENLNINEEVTKVTNKERSAVEQVEKDAREYLYKNVLLSDEEKEFRAHRTTNVLYDAQKAEGNEAQLLGLKEFHKWIYRNCDNTGFGEFFGANGSARAYMEDFMKAPYDQQIATLYMLENKTRRNRDLPTSEELADYVPNIKNLKEVMVSSKFKFWQRLNGKKHRWNKIKECMDRITEKQTPADKASVVDQVNNGIGVARSVLGIGDFSTSLAFGDSVANRVVGFVNNIQRAVQAVIGLVKGIGAWRKRDQEAETGEKANMIADIASAGLDTTVAGSNIVDFVQRAADGSLMDPNAVPTLASKIGLHTGLALNLIGATRSGINLSQAQYRNIKYGKLDDIVGDEEQIAALPDNDEKKKLVEKLKKHQHAISGINHRKVMNNALDLAGSSAWIGSSLASGAWGLMASAAAAGTAFVGAGIFTAPFMAMLKNKYEIYGYRRTIDSELYANDEQKNEEVGKLKTLISRRLNRLPRTEKNNSIRKNLESLQKSESSLLHHIRQNVARKQKCVNEKQLRNKMVAGMAGDLYDMHLQAPDIFGTAEENELNRIQREGADRLIQQAGGNIKTDQKTLEELQSDEVRQKNVGKIMKGLM